MKKTFWLTSQKKNQKVEKEKNEIAEKSGAKITYLCKSLIYYWEKAKNKIKIPEI